MAKYNKFDPRNKKKSKDKRAKQGRSVRIHKIDDEERVSKDELTRLCNVKELTT